MTSQAVFSELGSGARFDYRRYGGQIRKLSSKSATSTSSASASMRAQGAAGALPSSLDFFGSMSNPVAGAAGKVGRGKKKKKNNHPGKKKTDTHQHQQMRKKTKMKDDAAAAAVANKTARRKRPRL